MHYEKEMNKTVSFKNIKNAWFQIAMSFLWLFLICFAIGLIDIRILTIGLFLKILGSTIFIYTGFVSFLTGLKILVSFDY